MEGNLKSMYSGGERRIRERRESRGTKRIQFGEYYTRDTIQLSLYHVQRGNVRHSMRTVLSSHVTVHCSLFTVHVLPSLFSDESNDRRVTSVVRAKLRDSS
jgi:hypothetical protein